VYRSSRQKTAGLEGEIAAAKSSFFGAVCPLLATFCMSSNLPLGGDYRVLPLSWNRQDERAAKRMAILNPDRGRWCQMLGFRNFSRASRRALPAKDREQIGKSSESGLRALFPKVVRPPAWPRVSVTSELPTQPTFGQCRLSWAAQPLCRTLG
jgi:hypothetical protein